MQGTCMTCTSPSPAAGGHKRRHVSFLKSYAYTSSVTSSLLPSTWPPYTSICPFPAAAEWCLRAAGQPLPRCDTHAHRRCHCTSLTVCGICCSNIREFSTSGHDNYSKGFPHRESSLCRPHVHCAVASGFLTAIQKAGNLLGQAGPHLGSPNISGGVVHLDARLSSDLLQVCSSP